MLNQLAAVLRKQKGPARKQQDAAPVADAMRAFWQRDMLTLVSRLTTAAAALFLLSSHNGPAWMRPALTCR
jgi:hypothetical protein